jgi:hypothetical protein
LVFERAVGSRGEATGEGYSLAGFGKNTDDGWETPEIDHGADYVEVVAVLTTKATRDFIVSIYLTDRTGAWLETPAGIQAPFHPAIEFRR